MPANAQALQLLVRVIHRATKSCTAYSPTNFHVTNRYYALHPKFKGGKSTNWSVGDRESKTRCNRDRTTNPASNCAATLTKQFPLCSIWLTYLSGSGVTTHIACNKSLFDPYPRERVDIHLIYNCLSTFSTRLLLGPTRSRVVAVPDSRLRKRELPITQGISMALEKRSTLTMCIILFLVEINLNKWNQYK